MKLSTLSIVLFLGLAIGAPNRFQGAGEDIASPLARRGFGCGECGECCRANEHWGPKDGVQSSQPEIA
ncbi:unnamed protein product [Zymoseptoria tritici ST99CH_1A5]|uniref:4Fe-4S ferredoxin-type domain-containing protein n=2 Tax=Zymoseptoria tritici TaxID=1047171 RepID=A0A2H1GZ84_ZYMTR|nr:unnamed protein product [Zymoseptoria tritici ST99CH_1E4]SMY28084.1 unnamed protein product [Zymoseptoria tritici ST99CH_1A5]